MYYIVLYDNDIILPQQYNSWEEADDAIFKNHYHAYITIKEDNTILT